MARSKSGVRPGQRQSGYNLVVLVVMITVLNILIAKALPLWSAVIQREKEAELISRGMQYAEAIRVYQMRHGRPPRKLEELIEVEPRSIRQLWKNPMHEDGAWELIPQGAGRQVRANQNTGLEQNQELDQGRGQNPLPGDPSRPDPSRLWVPGNEDQQQIASFPIIGVKNPGGGDAIKTFVTDPSAPDGGASNDIGEWLFTVDLAEALVVPYDASQPTVPSMNVEQRFRPWPPNVKPIWVPAPKGGGEHAVDPRQQGQRGGGRNPPPRGSG